MNIIANGFYYIETTLGPVNIMVVNGQPQTESEKLTKFYTSYKLSIEVNEYGNFLIINVNDSAHQFKLISMIFC